MIAIALLGLAVVVVGCLALRMRRNAVDARSKLYERDAANAETWTFELTEEQQRMIDEWDVGQNAISASLQGDVEPNYGAIGGHLSYRFTPTSIGVVVVVEHAGSGAKLDVSEYDKW